MASSQETVTEVTDYDLSNWIAGSRLFASSDGKWFVVDADLSEYPDSPMLGFVRRSTQVLYCGPGGEVTDLIPDETFDPGTTPEEAAALMGYLLAP